MCAQEFKRRDYGWHYKNIHKYVDFFVDLGLLKPYWRFILGVVHK